MRAEGRYKSLADVRQAKEPPKCGSTGPALRQLIPKLLEETLGTKFMVVAGYQGGGEIDLAVERGELQCRALTIQAYHSREPYHTWRKTSFAPILMQTGKTRIRDWLMFLDYELMNDTRPRSGRRLLPLVMAATDFGRPIVAPPGFPADKTKIFARLS